MQLLVDTIPRLFKSKQDVLLFFKGAGASPSTFQDIAEQIKQDRRSVNKFEITRTILARLNEGGDVMIRARREVLKRVTEFEDFSMCWPEDRLAAQGLVEQVRKVINVKDSFTRMRMEQEAERRLRQAEQQAKLENLRARREEYQQIKDALNKLFSETNPQRRGRDLEGILNRLFRFSNILTKESFTLRGTEGEGIVEQIDGAVEFDGTIYLVEMKWWNQPLGVPEVSQHVVRVFNRGNVGGIVISAAGFTDPAIAIARDALSQKVVVLCDLREIVMLLDREADLLEFLRSKVRAASIDKVPYLH
jgi:restriction system protein